MANTHHTGIPRLQYAGTYPPCTPSVVITADINPFCAGDSVTFTPTFSCLSGTPLTTVGGDLIVTIDGNPIIVSTVTAYAWVLNGVIVSASASPYVNAALNDGDTVYFLFTTSDGNTYFSNVVTMVEKTSGCIQTVNYGLLYNWYAATDIRLISSAGWDVPENSDFNTLVAFCGGGTNSIVVKEVGTTYWNSPNAGATNSTGFNGRGSGIRGINGVFSSLKSDCLLASETDNGFGNKYYLSFNASTSFFGGGAGYSMKAGLAIRLLKTTTSLTDGQTGTYTGNDGKVYRTICIGTQEWLADNLCETKFRNGDFIHGYELGVYTPISTLNWAALITDGVCCYNDDTANI